MDIQITNYAKQKAVQFLEAMEGSGYDIPSSYLKALGLPKDISKLSVKGTCYKEALERFLSCDRECGCYDCMTHDWVPTFDEILESSLYAEMTTTDKIERLLVYLLQTGAKGYFNNIVGFDPRPTEENGYLWDREKSEFFGVFIGENGRRYSFRLRNKGGDNWERVYGLEEYFPDAESLS